MEDQNAEAVRLRRALRPLVLPTDILVVTEAHVEEWASVPGTVVHAALREGRVLHG